MILPPFSFPLSPNSVSFTKHGLKGVVNACICSSNLVCVVYFIVSRLLYPCSPHGGDFRCFSEPVSAVGSGLETTITDPKDNPIAVKNAKIVVESQDDDKIQVRVDVPGDDTQIVFDKVLADLARSAPPVNGFRRQKGGKTSKVPKDFMLQILGKDRVTKFVIQEIVSSTMTNYVDKEKLSVKGKKINTTQTAEELKVLFTPGNEFGFNVTLELEKSKTETTISSGSDDV